MLAQPSSSLSRSASGCSAHSRHAPVSRGNALLALLLLGQLLKEPATSIPGSPLHPRPGTGCAWRSVDCKQRLTFVGTVQSWEPDLVAAGRGLQAVTRGRAEHEAHGLLHCHSPALQGECNPTGGSGVTLHVAPWRLIIVSFFALFARCHYTQPVTGL